MSFRDCRGATKGVGWVGVANLALSMVGRMFALLVTVVLPHISLINVDLLHSK